MNETDWLTGDDPQAMLEHLKRTRRIHRTPAGKRKLRLFLCACFRNLWQYLPDPRTRAVVELAEELADAPINTDKINEVEESAQLAHWNAQKVSARKTDDLRPRDVSIAFLAALVHVVLEPEPWRAAASAARQIDQFHHSYGAIDALAGPPVRANVVREMFGNPFSPVVPDADWLEWHDGVVWKMARTIYNEYRFEDLPILADALEDAGCTESDLLVHCRSDGIHTRGCWAVDLLLGKG
jgi:hypothetical protein